MDLATPQSSRLPAIDAPPPPAAAARPDLLRLDLTVTYGAGNPVLRGVSLTVQQGERVGLIGVSGSGKSTLGLAVLGLAALRGARAQGSVWFQGQDLLTLPDPAFRKLRGKDIAFVPQSPLASLNPALSLGTQFREAWRAHADSPDWQSPTRELLAEVQLPATDALLKLYPSQLSVGMAQRVLIAMAALHRPRLLIADEPTSALDVITQAEILQLFRMLNRDGEGTALLYISHDLPSVAGLCERLVILHQGEIVESGPTRQIFTTPRHAHTRQLVEAIPRWVVGPVGFEPTTNGL
jgi:peptide/nickel transport system ATP-binding protein